MIFAIMAYVLSVVLSIFEICLLVRAICSWVPSFRDSRVYEFVYKITEPILRPIRDAFMRWEFARRCPIDLSFLVVVILVSVAQSFLYLFF